METVFATTEGVIWKQNAEWILGYNHYLGSCSIFEVELLGILDGLAIIQISGYKNVLIHTNSLESLKLCRLAVWLVRSQLYKL
ncbi:hypothetical protein Goari_009604 [Gossypium aridum]|uniref:RNase H type-1 domain-containing protein n=1 Tax=Gossypium aridum TaxID=34290 RepID=A0A7J8XXJ6_GOSAI|nr:hypothetical protein [Gossypium aridum]